MKTKLKTKILTFILIFNVLTLSFVPCINTYKTEAAAAGAATVANIAGYILSILGATDMLTNGGVRGVSGNVLDSLKAKISEKLGDGIYVDSDGNYVFSNSASSEIFNILNSNYGSSVRVISNFGSNESVLNISRMSSQFINSISSKCSDLGNYHLMYYQCTNGNYTGSVAFVCRSDNIAFILIDSGGVLHPYDSNLQQINVTFYRYACIYNISSGDFDETLLSDSISGNIYNYSVTSQYSSFRDYVYLNLPHFNTTNTGFFVTPSSIINNYITGGTKGYFSFRSNNSVIFSKFTNDANNVLNQNSGVVFFDSSSNIPNIQQSVINNNDWTKIYNNYISNVQTQYTNSDKDINKLRKIMKTYSDNIINIVNQGSDNVIQQIFDTNAWLSEIYDKIDQIYTYLTNMQSGGGDSDCPWTSEQITSMLNWLEQIENNTSYGYSIASSLDSIDENTYDSYTEILAMKTLLQQILSALQNGGGGGGTPSSPSYTIPNTKVPWDDLDDLTSDNITNYVTNTQIIQGLIEDTAIFAYAVIIGDIVNGLATEPQVPQFNIPFEYDSGYTNVSFDYDFDLDLDDLHFENVHALLIAGECVLFTLYCAWLFLKLIQIVYEFLK